MNITSKEAIDGLRHNGNYGDIVRDLRSDNLLRPDEVILADLYTNAILAPDLKKIRGAAHDLGLSSARALIGDDLLPDGEAELDDAVRLIEKYSPERGCWVFYIAFRPKQEWPVYELFRQVIDH